GGGVRDAVPEVAAFQERFFGPARIRQPLVEQDADADIVIAAQRRRARRLREANTPGLLLLPAIDPERRIGAPVRQDRGPAPVPPAGDERAAVDLAGHVDM